MNLDVTAFIRELAETRDELEKIVEDIYRDEEGVFEELQKLGFDSRYQELFLLNAKLTEGKKRKSERHYFTHPGTVAYILLGVLPDDYKPKEKAIAYGLSHDLLDESLDYNVEQFRNQRELNPHYRDEFDKAVLMAQPEMTGISRYRLALGRIAGILQVKDTGNPAIANALLADKLDNLTDLDYISKYRMYLDTRLPQKIAYTLFTAEQLVEQIHPDMFEIAQLAAAETTERYGLSVQKIHDYLEIYRGVLENHQSVLRMMSQRHLEKFEVLNVEMV